LEAPQEDAVPISVTGVIKGVFAEEEFDALETISKIMHKWHANSSAKYHGACIPRDPQSSIDAQACKLRLPSMVCAVIISERGVEEQARAGRQRAHDLDERSSRSKGTRGFTCREAERERKNYVDYAEKNDTPAPTRSIVVPQRATSRLSGDYGNIRCNTEDSGHLAEAVVALFR